MKWGDKKLKSLLEGDMVCPDQPQTNCSKKTSFKAVNIQQRKQLTVNMNRTVEFVNTIILPDQPIDVYKSGIFQPVIM